MYYRWITFQDTNCNEIYFAYSWAQWNGCWAMSTYVFMLTASCKLHICAFYQPAMCFACGQRVLRLLYVFCIRLFVALYIPSLLIKCALNTLISIRTVALHQPTRQMQYIVGQAWASLVHAHNKTYSKMSSVCDLGLQWNQSLIYTHMWTGCYTGIMLRWQAESSV